MSSFTTVVVIRGGGIAPDAAVETAWFPDTETIEGKTMFTITCDYRCKKFLDGREKMHNHLINMRNAAVDKLMQDLAKSDDPDGDDIIAPNIPKRAKRQMIDDIPKLVELGIQTTTGGPHAVVVASARRYDAMLSMELTEENLNLLHEDPQVVKNHKFKCQETNVAYIPSRSAARCIYRSADGKTKYKHVKMIHETTAGQEEIQRAIDTATAEC